MKIKCGLKCFFCSADVSREELDTSEVTKNLKHVYCPQTIMVARTVKLAIFQRTWVRTDMQQDYEKLNKRHPLRNLLETVRRAPEGRYSEIGNLFSSL